MKKSPLEMAIEGMTRDLDKRGPGPVKTALQRQLDMVYSYLEWDPEWEHQHYVAGFKDGMKINNPKTIKDASSESQDQH